MYQLKPEGMKGGELFAHMIRFKESHNWKDDEFDISDLMVSPRRYLDVEVKPKNQAVLRAATGASNCRWKYHSQKKHYQRRIWRYPLKQF
jgi:hypothetical protein